MWPLGITPVFNSRQKGVKILMMMMMVMMMVMMMMMMMMMMMVRQNCAGVNLITIYFTL